LFVIKRKEVKRGTDDMVLTRASIDDYFWERIERGIALV
jgi:hypothetical protein